MKCLHNPPYSDDSLLRRCYISLHGVGAYKQWPDFNYSFTRRVAEDPAENHWTRTCRRDTQKDGGCSERDWGTSWNGFIQNDVLKMQNISRPIIRHLISCANNSDTICLGGCLWIQVLFTNHITIFALLRAHPRTGSIRSRAGADMIYTCPSSLFISWSTTRHPCHLNGVNSSSLQGIISTEMFQGFRSPLPPF